jgi:hypothetical protein
LVYQQRQFGGLAWNNGPFPSACVFSNSILLTTGVFTETEIFRRESLGLKSLPEGEPAGPNYRPPHARAEIVKCDPKVSAPQTRAERDLPCYGGAICILCHPSNDSWLVNSPFLTVFLFRETVTIWRSIFVIVASWEQGSCDTLIFRSAVVPDVSPRYLLSIRVHVLL